MKTFALVSSMTLAALLSSPSYSEDMWEITTIDKLPSGSENIIKLNYNDLMATYYIRMNESEPGSTMPGRSAEACVMSRMFPIKAVQIHTKAGGMYGTRRWIVFCERP